MLASIKIFSDKQDLVTIIFVITSLLDIAQKMAFSAVRIKNFGFIICEERFINQVTVQYHYNSVR